MYSIKSNDLFYLAKDIQVYLNKKVILLNAKFDKRCSKVGCVCFFVQQKKMKIWIHVIKHVWGNTIVRNDNCYTVIPNHWKNSVGQVGFEPTTFRLHVPCSNICRHLSYKATMGAWVNFIWWKLTVMLEVVLI